MESIVAEANLIFGNLLPEKSKDKYLRAYNTFMEWKNQKQIDGNDFGEEVMIVYFDHLKKNFKPSSIWCFYSMLRTVIQRNHNVDINYPKIQTFLKMMVAGFQPKKSAVFQGEDLCKFLCEAPDMEFLATKVILIFGIYGATRADELTRVEVKDIEQHGDVFVIRIPQTKTKIVRSFTVEKENADYLKKYLDLRPPITTSDRFFLNYQKGKCFNQAIGRNKFLGTPKIIARFLNLPNPDSFSGHSFRRTSATLLADAGGDILTLKRHGGWRSSTAAEGYVQDSITSKRKIGELIAGQIDIPRKRSTSTSTITSATAIQSSKDTESDLESTVALSQSIVTVIRSSQRVAVEPLSNNIAVQKAPNHIAVPLPRKFDDLQHMQFNNCAVNIHFHP